MGNPINSFPDFSGIFGDKRIDNRASKLLKVLTQGRSSSIRQITSSEGEQKSFYRLFNNESFGEDIITNAIVNRCGQLCHDRHLLCIERTHLLIRSNHNRKIEGGGTLSNHLDAITPLHDYHLMVRGDVRKKIEKRTVDMELKWSKVSIMKPSGCKDKNLADSVEVYVVEAKEKGKNKGIYWRIITTHPVENAVDAMQVIEWYKHRWYIEQVHRLLKTEGFRIESSQLEQGWAIRKLTLLAMMAVLRILQMMLAYEDDNEQPVDEVFTKDEQACLQMINEQEQGKTDKLKNQSKPTTLKWATWIIARLGGWKGYKSSRKPGPIVFQKGLIKFYNIYQGWNLYKNKPILVSAQ